MNLEIRRRQTEGAIRALRDGIAGWLEKRRKADRNGQGLYIGRHKTQLQSIESVLGGSAKALCVEAAGIDPAALPAGEFYRRCRRVDEATAWLQRVWEFYRDRFDQRDGPLGATVRAADEIVWSAYHGVMRTASDAEHGPAPLAFIAPEYSPSAIDDRRPLAQHLRLYLEFPAFDDRLSALVKRLAVPLLALPTWCVDAPWWLVFVAHEVGHRLTKQLDLALHFAATIDATVKARGKLSGAEDTRWKAWHDEIAADAWSVALLGPAAAEALAEVELAGPEALRAPAADGRYPPPVIRLALMSRYSDTLGLGVPALPDEFALAAHEAAAPAVAQLAAHLDFVVEALAAPLPGKLGTLHGLAGIDTAAASPLAAGVEYWRHSVLAQPIEEARTLEAPRYISAGVFRAWHDSAAAAETADAHAKQATAVATAAFAVFAEAGPDGERGSEQPQGDEPGLAKELSELLLALSDAQAPDVAGAGAAVATI
jgi:hypothetical protein